MQALVRLFLLSLVRLFFPVRIVKGRERIPTGVPVIFVLNHPNGLLDPVVLRVALDRPVGFLAKSTLFGNPLGRLGMGAFSAIPVYRQKDVGHGGGDPSRNEETFAQCRRMLACGDAIALFPEGVSHADAQMKPLKTGAARIALSAEREEGGARGVHIVPVGLAYEQRAVFRSRVVLVVGEPVRVADFHDEAERDERGAVEHLTEVIRARLAEVVVQAETRELLEGVARIAMWTADDPSIRDDVGAQQTRARELLAAYEALKVRDAPRVDAIVADAQAYMQTLADLGVRDPWSLEFERVRLGPALRVTASLLWMAPFALVGAVLGWVPYRLAGIVSARVTREEDVLGTVKLLAGALFLAIGWTLEAVAVGVWLGPGWGVGLWLVGPATGYLALRWSEQAAVAWEALRHAQLRERDTATVARLKDRRQALADEVARALREASVA